MINNNEALPDWMTKSRTVSFQKDPNVGRNRKLPTNLMSPTFVEIAKLEIVLSQTTFITIWMIMKFAK